MRLSGGENNQEGTVDICIGGVWGTVCDDFWGSLDLQAIGIHSKWYPFKVQEVLSNN